MNKLITAPEFYKIVTKGDIYRAYRYIVSNNIELKVSTKYKVKLYDRLFPPKDFLRVVAEQKGYKIKETGFNGGQANKPFEELGYEIMEKDIVVENVKKEFINWYLNNASSSYYNDYERFDGYLEKALEDFTINIFECNISNYMNVIKIIKRQFEDNKPRYSRSHNAPDGGKLAAILGTKNYFKFLKEKFNDKHDAEKKINEIDRLLIVLKKMGQEKSVFLINHILLLTKKLKIKYNDQRVTYNLPKSDTLIGVTIGQKYILTLDTFDEKSFYGYINLKNEPDWYILKETNKEIKQNWSNIEEDARKNLEITLKSGYRKSSSFLVEKIIFDSNFRNEVFLKAFNSLFPENNFNMKKQPINQILYGPPGTGKTYNTINKAVAIANPSFDLEKDRAIVKQEYDRLINKGQIIFTTFHQSMAYEDFVEGIKPKTKEDLVSYEVQDGIFKKLCNNAETFSAENTTSVSKKVDIENRVQKLKEELEQSEDSEIEVSMTKASYHITDITDKHIKFRKASGGTGHDLVLDSLKKIAIGEKDMIGGLRAYYDYLISYLYKYKIEEKEVEVNKPFVLIIDEINRGNVSAIFGELITLLEPSKRLGNNEALMVTLPYSKETFGVPNNLHIIGTMNTADRSVEALDTALRRRFVFEEMMPNTLLLKDKIVESITLSKLLEKINKRVEALIDRDHAIGHSYFINVTSMEELKTTFKDCIIPLLQEYFYGDDGKIGLVLGEGFVKIVENDDTIFSSFEYQGRESLVSQSYEIIPFDQIDFKEAIAKLLA